jgi:hypothetical protein
MLAVLLTVGAALAFGLTACGGSSTTTVTTTSTSGATSARLSARSWTNYQTVAAKAKTENNKATYQFGYCKTLTTPIKQSKTLIDSCFATSTAAVLQTGGEASGFLQALMLETNGACHDALSKTNDEVNAYVAAVQKIDADVKAGNEPSTSDVDAAKSALKSAQNAKTEIAPACQPQS